MCLLCVEIQKQNMTRREVARAYREYDIPDDHVGEVMVKIHEHYGLDPVAEELSKIYEEEFEKEHGHKLE